MLRSNSSSSGGIWGAVKDFIEGVGAVASAVGGLVPSNPGPSSQSASDCGSSSMPSLGDWLATFGTFAALGGTYILTLATTPVTAPVLLGLFLITIGGIALSFVPLSKTMPIILDLIKRVMKKVQKFVEELIQRVWPLIKGLLKRIAEWICGVLEDIAGWLNKAIPKDHGEMWFEARKAAPVPWM